MGNDTKMDCLSQTLRKLLGSEDFAHLAQTAIFLTIEKLLKDAGVAFIGFSFTICQA